MYDTTKHSEHFLCIFFSILKKITNANISVFGFNNILLICVTVDVENVVFTHTFTCSMKALFMLKFGFVVYPIDTEQKGDLLIRDLWQQGTDSVHDMIVVNTDTLSYVCKSLEKCLHDSERGKKKMYLEACLQQR